MTPHKIAQEMTGEELMSVYNIVSVGPRVKSWVKPFTLESLDTDYKDYSGRLHWDEDNGYEIFWNGEPAPESNRPEFAYTLDSLIKAGF